MFSIKGLLKAFEGIASTLAENGWFISEPQSPRWWGGLESPDEVFISAMLVQQTRWDNVTRVMAKLRSLGLSRLEQVSRLSYGELANMLTGINFRSTKARRVINAARRVVSMGGLEALGSMGDDEVRQSLLSIEGIGYETADSIMLFALNRLTIPVSAYTVRVLGRVDKAFNGGYEELRVRLMGALPRGLYEYKLFHAGIVTVGKVWCLKGKPRCSHCPLREYCTYAKFS